MRIKFILSAFILVLTALPTHAQTPLTNGLYTIDQKIALQVKKFPMIDSGRLRNSMKIKVPWDNHTFFDQSLDCFTRSLLLNDTIYITGHIFGLLGYGFQLVLFRDSCIVAPFALSDSKIYKHNRSDADSIAFILLPCINHKVVLAKKPIFKEGEIVEGFVDLKSQPFYYKDLPGTFNIQIQAYFKTTPIKRIN
jgi:hypothetical protein